MLDYYQTADERKSTSTDYAKKMSVYCDESNNAEWWLRSPYYYSNNAKTVNVNGSTYDRYVSDGNRGVRPVLWIEM